MVLAPEPVAIDRPATATVVTLRLPDSAVGVEVGLQPGDGGRVGADQGQGVVVGQRGGVDRGGAAAVAGDADGGGVGGGDG